jgi:hypothetical protein
MRTRLTTFATIFASAGDGAPSPSVRRSAGVAIAYGAAVWHDTQKVS